MEEKSKGEGQKRIRKKRNTIETKENNRHCEMMKWVTKFPKENRKLWDMRQEKYI